MGSFGAKDNTASQTATERIELIREEAPLMNVWWVESG